MSAGAGHQDSAGQAQEGRRAGADTCQVLLSVKSCQVLLSAGAGVGNVQQRGGGGPGAGLGGGRGRQVSSSTSGLRDLGSVFVITSAADDPSVSQSQTRPLLVPSPG